MTEWNRKMQDYTRCRAEEFLIDRDYYKIEYFDAGKDMTLGIFQRADGNRLNIIHLSDIEVIKDESTKDMTFNGIFDYRMMIFFDDKRKGIIPIYQSVWNESSSDSSKKEYWTLNNTRNDYLKNKIYLIDDDLSGFVKTECQSIQEGHCEHKNLSGLIGIVRKKIIPEKTIDDYVIRIY